MIRKGIIKIRKKHHRSTQIRRLRWILEDKTLTLIGEGSMPDFTEESPPPWDQWREEIRELNLWELKNVGARAFQNCPNLTDVYLDKSIERIGSFAFAGCAALERVHTDRETLLHLESGRQAEHPQALYFGRRAFAGTPWGNARIGDFVIFRDSLLEYLGEAEKVQIPEGIREIGQYAFEGRPVTEVTLPESLTLIRSFAFARTKIQELIVPMGVQKIEAFAFAFTDRLRRVILENEKVVIARDAFYETKFHHRHSDGNRKWSSIYSLSGDRERKIEAGRRLTVQRKKGHFMGVRSHDLNLDLLRRIRRGNLIVRICVDETEKRVCFVQSFRWRTWLECPETYLLYPEIMPDGEVLPWRDSYTLWEDEDILFCSTEGLQGEGGYYWYVCPDSTEMGCGPELELLRQWLHSHPEYRLDTREENIARDGLRMFVAC